MISVRPRSIAFCCAGFLICLASAGSWAAPGDLDSTFGTGGVATLAIGTQDDFVGAVLVQPDGKIVAAGSAAFGSSRFAVVRFDAVGAVDGTFGTGGVVTTSIGSATSDFGAAALVQPDGKVVVVGAVDNAIGLARYDASGVLDPSFGSGGTVVTRIGSVARGDAAVLQPNGKIVAVGAAHNGSDFDIALARYETDGSLDLTFGTGGRVVTSLGSTPEFGWAAAIQPDGKIVVAGQVDTAGVGDAVVLRYEPDGTLDATFGIGGVALLTIGSGLDTGYGLALQPDGKIVVAGLASTPATSIAVTRLDATGAPDAGFGTGGTVLTPVGTYSVANDVVIQPDGRIVVAGSGLSVGTGYDIALVRYDADGSPDAGFGTGGIVTTAIAPSDNEEGANGLALQPDGQIVVGGASQLTAGNYDAVVLRYEGTPRACGNGVVEPGETCDDGGTTAGDGCDATCAIETGYACVGMPSTCTAGCGDGAVAGSEGCDDGDATSGDGCSAVCQVEPGWVCAGGPSTCSAVCGDSRVVGPEQCDDGNTTGGDCCDATCGFEAPGTSCLDEGDLCSADVCGASGVCQHLFAPDPLCLQPIEVRKAQLKIVQGAVIDKDQLQFKWTRGPVVPKASFGTPPAGTPTYALCVYDESGGVPSRAFAGVPSGDADCSDGACWTESTKAWKLKNKAGLPDGIVVMKLQEGLVAGKSKVQVKAKGAHLVVPSLPLSSDPSVVAEVRTSDGQCFGATFSTPIVNDAAQYRATSD
jgi:uncharacterized delta-60 repeat protein